MRTLQISTLLAAAMLLALPGCKKAKAKRASADEPTTEEAKSTGEPGVFEDRIVLYSTATFTGPNTSWGADTWRGSQAYISEVNAKGGVHGRKIEIVSQDDGYETPRAMVNVKAAIEKNDFFAMYNFVGSNIMIETVAELEKIKDKNIFQVGSIASTSAFRKSDRAFAVRAPISLEMKQAVDAFIANGKKKIAVFHQDDAYGGSGRDGVIKALEAHGLKPVAVTKHGVFQKFDESVKPQVDEMRNAGAEVVFDIGNYQAAAALVRDARESKWAVPVVNNASINDAFVRTLLAHEKKSGTKLAYNLVGVKVVPSPDETSYPMIKEYRELIDLRNPKTPPELTDPNFRQNTYAFQQVEGFVNAKIMVEILNRMGPKPVRAKFKEAAESIKNWDVGLGETKVTFGPDDHTALDKVWLYYVNKEGDWVPLADMNQALTTHGGTPSAPAPTPAAAGKTAPAAKK